MLVFELLKTVGEAEREIEMLRQTLCNLPEFSVSQICNHIASFQTELPRGRKRIDCITDSHFKHFFKMN